jgi:hypothetical protein
MVLVVTIGELATFTEELATFLEERATFAEGVTATARPVWTYRQLNRPKPLKVEKQFYLTALNKLRIINTEGHLRL